MGWSLFNDLAEPSTTPKEFDNRRTVSSAPSARPSSSRKFAKLTERWAIGIAGFRLAAVIASLIDGSSHLLDMSASAHHSLDSAKTSRVAEADNSLQMSSSACLSSLSLESKIEQGAPGCSEYSKFSHFGVGVVVEGKTPISELGSAGSGSPSTASNAPVFRAISRADRVSSCSLCVDETLLDSA